MKQHVGQNDARFVMTDKISERGGMQDAKGCE
jgi:hypothetical protein